MSEPAQVSAVAAPRPTPLMAALVTIGVAAVIAGFIYLCLSLHVTLIYMAFLFSVYWSGIKGGAWPEFVPALLGALAGIGTAFLVWYLPPHYSLIGVAIVGCLILFAVFCLIAGYLKSLFNMSFMLFLTVGNIPSLQREHEFLAMIEAVALSAAFFGLLQVIIVRVTAPRAK